MSELPNILLVMSDEHCPMFSGAYGHRLVETPNIDRLSNEGATFDAAYCNSPLCVPSRMSMMTGRFVHRIETWDNTTPLRSDLATWAHSLRLAGYEVTLAGKQHFVGPDRLHGFCFSISEDLHATQTHPIWRWAEGPHVAREPWNAAMNAGPGVGAHIAADDATVDAAVAYLKEASSSRKPYALCVGLLAPHFPLVVPGRYWQKYPPETVDMPNIPAGHLDQLHPATNRLRRALGLVAYPEEVTRRARAGYYGLVSYLDDKIGELLEALTLTGQREDTLVIYTSDHGEMAGEHGMWRKSTFYEESVRVPLLLSWPGRIPAGKHIDQVVSLVDLSRTLADLGRLEVGQEWDGSNLLPLLSPDFASFSRGSSRWNASTGVAFSEYLAHGVTGPTAMLRRGRYKYIYHFNERPELYDLVDDPGEVCDLALDPGYAAIVQDLRDELLSSWDARALDVRIRDSQAERSFIIEAGGWASSVSRP